MKKFLSIAAFMLFTICSAHAVEGRLGVTLKAGYFEADNASEIFSGAHSSGASPGTVTKQASGEGDVAEGEFGYGSIFAEVMANDKIGIGINYVPMALESETTENVQKTTIAAKSTVTNKVQIDFEELTTLYVALNVTDNMYIKAGMVTVDVITNESLGTGSTYGNTDLDGTQIGFGINNEFGNGMFIRAEGSYMTFDGASLSSNDNKITLSNLDGLSGKLAIGRSF